MDLMLPKSDINWTLLAMAIASFSKNNVRILPHLYILSTFPADSKALPVLEN